MNSPQRIAFVGAGWAGLAAAVRAVQLGHRVTVFEAARSPGGRARAVPLALPGGDTLVADNGQHILIGAYTATLALMRAVGVEPAQALQRLPLTLRYPDGSGLALPRLRPPLDAAAGILTARGWRWAERLALLRAA
ncbi:FAD-dependent oxidoreductase, partial [Ottowia sp.]|uniref:FAD-dependent oxidoreductase n=1 Tax=Ottowia sp. TaxID=1898956 RepID=UPI0039E6F410